MNTRDQKWMFGGLIFCFSLLSLWVIYRAIRFSMTSYLAGAPPQDVINLIIPKDLKPSDLHPPAIRPTDPVRFGGTTSSVAVILYGDFTDEGTRTLLPKLSRIASEYHGTVRLVWRDLPSSDSARAVPVAVFARCAQQQGKFWSTADAIVTDPNMNDFRLTMIGGALKLDDQQLYLCRKDPSIEANIASDVHDSQFDGLTKAPLFFIGTRAYTDVNMSDQDIRAAIKQALSS